MKAWILIFLFTVPVVSQGANDSLYARGLQMCLEKELASYATFTQKDLRNVIVEYDFYITKNLPQRMGEITVRYLNDSEMIREFRKLSKEDRKRGIPFIKIFPISDKDGKLFFAYNNYWFTYSEKGGVFSKKVLSLGRGLEGGCNGEIGFDSLEKKFYMTEAKIWGI
ncbi:MAG: hypothetical protein IPM50_10490 [Acidobacteriota bacterium]|nr:MAG: hypothetical protein IPM50_10490 [Acidobacteriota bacterium]